MGLSLYTFNGKYSGQKHPPRGGGALIQGSPKKTRGKLVTCSPGYWREAPKCFIYQRNTLVCYLDWWNSLLSVLYHLKFSLNSETMFFHHYSEVNKLREKFAQSVKNKGQIRSSIWGVGFYSGFWPEYIPLFSYAKHHAKHLPISLLHLVMLSTSHPCSWTTSFSSVHCSV